MKKLAFCFLIYDVINHEELWRRFFDGVDPEKFTIYIHYKYQKPLKFFESYKLPPNECIETKYENETIPLAYNVLLRKAFLTDDDNYKFIMVSGSCVPLKSFDSIYDFLTKTHHGYFNICPQSQCFPNCNVLLEKGHVDYKHISKSHNWFILNRVLVENLCFDKDEFLHFG
jgi:hypothetical protein